MIELELIARLVIAGILGALVGFEREKRYKEAGLRTHFLVAVGSALAMIVSKYAFFDVVNSGTIELGPKPYCGRSHQWSWFLRCRYHSYTTSIRSWVNNCSWTLVNSWNWISDRCRHVYCKYFWNAISIIALEILSRLFQPVFPKFHKLTIHVRTNEAISGITHYFIRKSFRCEIVPGKSNVS